MSILSVDQIQPIGSGTTITLNATEVKTGTEITVGTGASIFSPAGNTLTFGTNNVERIRIKNDGKVGINTSNTSNAKLEISDRSTGTFSGLAVGTQYGTSLFGGYNNYPAIMNYNQQPLIYCDTVNDRTELFGDTVGFGTTCAFRVNNVERFRIDSSGRMGIGDNSPDRELVVKNASSNASIKIEASNAHTSQLFFSDTDAENVGRISIFHGSGQATSNSMLFDLAGTTRLMIDSYGVLRVGNTHSQNTSSNTKRIALGAKGSIWGWVTGQINGALNLADNYYWDGSNNKAIESDHCAYLTLRSGSLRFGATNSSQTGGQNISGGINERFRINSSGSVFVGKTSASFSTTGVELHTNGLGVFSRSGLGALAVNRNTNNGTVVSFMRSGTEVGKISVTTSSTSYSTSGSDRSLKKNFEDWTENTLNLFKNINPQKFNFIFEEDTKAKTKGYIAQDLVDSFPEAYPKDDEGKYMFNPSGMVVYLMKGIQELSVENAALKARLDKAGL